MSEPGMSIERAPETISLSEKRRSFLEEHRAILGDWNKGTRDPQTGRNQYLVSEEETSRVKKQIIGMMPGLNEDDFWLWDQDGSALRQGKQSGQESDDVTYTDIVFRFSDEIDKNRFKEGNYIRYRLTDSQNSDGRLDGVENEAVSGMKEVVDQLRALLEIDPELDTIGDKAGLGGPRRVLHAQVLAGRDFEGKLSYFFFVNFFKQDYSGTITREIRQVLFAFGRKGEEKKIIHNENVVQEEDGAARSVGGGRSRAANERRGHFQLGDTNIRYDYTPTLMPVIARRRGTQDVGGSGENSYPVADLPVKLNVEGTDESVEESLSQLRIPGLPCQDVLVLLNMGTEDHKDR